MRRGNSHAHRVWRRYRRWACSGWWADQGKPHRHGGDLPGVVDDPIAAIVMRDSNADHRTAVEEATKGWLHETGAGAGDGGGDVTLKVVFPDDERKFGSLE